MKTQKRVKISPLSVDITRFDAVNTPSLVGFWPCDDGFGTTILDKSGYGNHLTHITRLKEVDIWKDNPGWLYIGSTNYCTLSPLPPEMDIAGTTKVVVLSCEVDYLLDQSTDWDFGLQASVPVAAVNGSLIIDSALNFGARAKTDEGVGYDNTALIPYGTAPCSVSVSGAIVPGDKVKASVYGSAITESAHTGTTDPIEIAAFHLHDTTIGQDTSVRNVQCWIFDSAPTDLDMTLQWMSANPGKIPKWWEGR